MIPEEQLSEAIQEFLEYSSRHPERVYHTQHELCEWTDDRRLDSSHLVTVPSANATEEDVFDEVPELGSLVDALVTDDDISLIQSHRGALKAIDRIIKERRAESNRPNADDQPEVSDPVDILRSDKAHTEYIAPIIGLSFEDRITITDDLTIRPLTDLEKELILNARTIGDGSVALRRAAKLGNVTNTAAFGSVTAVDDGWEGGISLSADISQEAPDALEDLKTALRLTHPEGFRMDVWHLVDRTLYPSILNSKEEHGSNEYYGTTEPEPTTNTDGIVDSYHMVSETDLDEGLRVAIDRLESSYRKVSNADGVVDAVIGIEALLSSGRSGSFQEVRRRATILSEQKATYSELGRLQTLRNATVHGEERQVSADDLHQARSLLSVLLNRMVTEMNDRKVSRGEMIETIDTALTKTVENQFDEILSRYESM
jgi:hypothetical protein